MNPFDIIPMTVVWGCVALLGLYCLVSLLSWLMEVRDNRAYERYTEERARLDLCDALLTDLRFAVANLDAVRILHLVQQLIEDGGMTQSEIDSFLDYDLGFMSTLINIPEHNEDDDDDQGTGPDGEGDCVA